MLKALELVGFKSFADKTRFDFPDGITVVVGPNGSGKSNVVDAIKWVLGAQSAKALRGADMSDVIFKGSAEGGRKPANSAEVTLILDNQTRLLSFDADVVEVCRRVYRSGEGEYAINGQPCRLKDVRDVFRGTGVGVDAYSLIEQGKVDRLLQASARDRRAIFEEAAGISRFKAKKAEAERRLTRVDQNMLRIRDIVDELGKRLATLKNQANKAQRYREWTSQIEVKRMQLGLFDLRQCDRQLGSLDAKTAESLAQRDALVAQVNSSSQELHSQSLVVRNLNDALEEAKNQSLSHQRQHVQATSELSAARERLSEWSAEHANILERIELLERRVSLGEEEIQERRRELTRLDEERMAALRGIEAIEEVVVRCESQSQSAKEALESQRREHTALRDELAQHKLDATSHTREIEQLALAIGRIDDEIAQRSMRREHVRSEIERIATELNTVRTEFDAAEESKRVAKHAYQTCSDQQRAQQQIILELQARIQGIQERLSFLAQLEEQFTNAGRGGHQLMRSAHTVAGNSPAGNKAVQSILGLVADLIATDLHLAPLVDVSLGTTADAVVLSDGHLVDWINEGRLVPEGRVTLLRMDRLPTRRTGEKIQLDGLRGVIGRADRLVRFQSSHEPLVRALLGTTWFVESLATALDLSHFRGAGLRFVTAECQLVDSDGSITIGSLQTGLGLVSRRSEMQATNEQKQALMASLAEARQVLEAIDIQWHAAGENVRASEDSLVDAARKLASIEQRLESMHDQSRMEEETLQVQRADLDCKAQAQMALAHSLLKLQQIVLSFEDTERQHASRADELLQNIHDREQELQSAQSRLVEHRIETARLEQRVDGMRLTLDQLQQDASERSTHVESARSSLTQLIERMATSQRATEELNRRIESADQGLSECELHRQSIALELESQQELVAQTTKLHDLHQRQLDKLLDRIAGLEHDRQRVVAERVALLTRYRDEYQIDLADPESAAAAQMDQASDVEDWNRSELESQLAQLRQEIAAAGSVNMEALDELDELESRYNRLSAQENDLLEAKAGLIKTMLKIDVDSQDLFIETLEAIRLNFQQLYRKSFGGGSADIVLENPEDPESGIEILCTPPGKTTFSNSLLSGGEKALTAVSLIMAFFQYRPSPFCILDEVDAPFDEANIGRFVTVLNEFLDTTKFIVVTHSKKTMTVANMIYGVTMQESGVSRQVAVKFEEVNDQGEIIQRDNRRVA